MSFVTLDQIELIKDYFIYDSSELKREYRKRKNENEQLTIDKDKSDNYIKDGWEIEREYKVKTKLKRKKEHESNFLDNMWCMFYDLGYRTLNRDNEVLLPYTKDKMSNCRKIDLIAINDETVFLVDCKSSETSVKNKSILNELEILKTQINGLRKVLFEIFGRDIKIKFIYSTRNFRNSFTNDEIKSSESLKIFHFNDNTYQYVYNLIKNYKEASLYQFLGLVFKNELINNNKIEIPAVEGWMGKKKYYMFSIEPNLLLKIGFILHRTKANDLEFPTYQRLLVPSRLKGITKFIDAGGYFPNSIIINFNDEKNKILFESSSSISDSRSRIGVLKIPNAYAIAFIIDGQHRLYGYANSNFKETNTIPVVALNRLEAEEQLSIFMDINENQKAVKPSLRLDLEEYLYWNSERVDSRMKALRSSIIKQLGIDSNSPLYNKISIGEDKSILTFDPFYRALSKCGLLPNVKGNKYEEKTLSYALFNVNEPNYHKEMEKAKRDIVIILIKCFDFVADKYSHIFNKEKFFILSNRGVYAFISLIGSLNEFLTTQEKVNYQTPVDDRYFKLEIYIDYLLKGLDSLPEQEKESHLSFLGAGADIKWLRLFQTIINKSDPNYFPLELADWQERQDEELQSIGRSYGIDIEKSMKKRVLMKLEELYSNKWELEIGSIKRDCVGRALSEDERNHKEGVFEEDTDWKSMFNINDYKVIIEKHWTKKTENIKDSFLTFEKDFSIDIGSGFNSKSEKIKWISRFNSYRNLWAHEGSKEKRLNKEEVQFLKTVHSHFISG